MTCIDTCPGGSVCGAVSNTGTDVTYICAPLFAMLCVPCDSDADCAPPIGENGETCQTYGDEGGFCTAACGEGGLCPEGYACSEEGKWSPWTAFSTWSRPPATRTPC